MSIMALWSHSSGVCGLPFSQEIHIISVGESDEDCGIMHQATCYVYIFVHPYPWMIGFCVMHKCGNLNYRGAGEVMDTFSSERKVLLPVEMESAYVLEVQ